MKLSGLIGNPIGHSKSSAIFNRIFSSRKMEAFYVSMDIKPKELEDFVKASKTAFCGYNVTAPFKISIMQYLDSIDPEAEKIGSVNLIRVSGSKTTGYNTDMAGFARAVKDIDFNNKRILVAGSGGIFRTVAYYILQSSRPAVFHVASRDPIEARKGLSGTPITGAAKIISMTEVALRQYDVLINCTPLGTYPQISASPFIDRTIDSASIGIDVVYNPPMTHFLNRMSSKGGKIVTGEDLFIYQALESMRILFKMNVDPEEVRKILREVLSYE